MVAKLVRGTFVLLALIIIFFPSSFYALENPSQPKPVEVSKPETQTQTQTQTEKVLPVKTQSTDISVEAKRIQQSFTSSEWKLSIFKVLLAFFTFLFFFISLRYVAKLMEHIAERWNNSRLLIKKLIPIVRIFGWVIVIYIIISQILAPPFETIVTFTASAGIALGFASQDILKNIFAGIMILFDNPFQVGDKITIGDHYGEVVQIGLRSVRIVTPDDNTVSVPNSEIMNQSVSNANSGKFNCQVTSELFLPSNSDIGLIKEIAYKAAASSRYIYLNKPIAIIFKHEVSHGNVLLKLKIKAYVLDLRYEFPFTSDITETVINEMIKRNIPIL